MLLADYGHCSVLVVMIRHLPAARAIKIFESRKRTLSFPDSRMPCHADARNAAPDSHACTGTISGRALARTLVPKSSSSSYTGCISVSAGPMLALIPWNTRSGPALRARSDGAATFPARHSIFERQSSAREGVLEPSPQHGRLGGLVSVAAPRHAEMETQTPFIERNGRTTDYKSAQRPPLGDLGNVEEKRLRCEAGTERRVTKQSACTRSDGAIQSADQVKLLNEARVFLRRLKHAPSARALPRTTDPFSWPLCRIAEPEENDDDETLSDSPLKPGHLLIWNREDETYPMNEHQ